MTTHALFRVQTVCK